jgi:L,D-peptidoglycan transpeptidase YkuD (ErfK/YbiS/YcfS/YnhG family)
MKIKKSFLFILLFSIFLTLLSLPGCVFLQTSAKFNAVDFLKSQEDKIPKSSQILLAVDDSLFFFTRTTLYSMEKRGDNWQTAFKPFDAVIGRNGFAPQGEKREGDGRTPSGIYPLKTAFGYDETIKTKMPYRQALADDIWVDDPNAADYNHWVKKDQTQAASCEMMKRDDDLYKYGIVIEYNTDPVIKGNGSAIFLHIWKCPGLSTAGCVAVSEQNLIKILEWLDPDASPLIITGIRK